MFSKILLYLVRLFKKLLYYWHHSFSLVTIWVVATVENPLRENLNVYRRGLSTQSIIAYGWKISALVNIMLSDALPSKIILCNISSRKTDHISLSYNYPLLGDSEAIKNIILNGYLLKKIPIDNLGICLMKVCYWNVL